MPEIIVLCGIPCSGKSTWARIHQMVYKCNIISRDEIREIHMSKPYIYSKQNEDEVTRIFDFQYSKCTNMYRDIILDNTYCKPGYLNDEIKRKPEGYTLRFMFFNCPLWKAHIRNVLRFIETGKWIPIKIMNQMKKNYDKIDKKKYDLVF